MMPSTIDVIASPFVPLLTGGAYAYGGGGGGGRGVSPGELELRACGLGGGGSAELGGGGGPELGRGAAVPHVGQNAAAAGNWAPQPEQTAMSLPNLEDRTI